MQDVRLVFQVSQELYSEVIKPLQTEKKLSKVLVELLESYRKDRYVEVTTNLAVEDKERKSLDDLKGILEGMQDNLNALKYLNKESDNLVSEGFDTVSSIISDEEVVSPETDFSFLENKFLELENKSKEKLLLMESNFVTKEEFNQLMEGQNEILKLLKSGSLFDKAKSQENLNKEKKDVVNSEDKSNVEETSLKGFVKEDIPVTVTVSKKEVEKQDEDIFDQLFDIEEKEEIKDDSEETSLDGSKIAASLLEGMSFNF